MLLTDALRAGFFPYTGRGFFTPNDLYQDLPELEKYLAIGLTYIVYQDLPELEKYLAIGLTYIVHCMKN